MARPAKYDSDTVLAAAAAVVSEAGPTALTISGVARRVGAPSGSMYHRFATRDHLAAALWLDAVESFQEGWVAAAADPDAWRAAAAAARHVVVWSRDHHTRATVLLRYRREDLMSAEWPAEFRARNRDQHRRAKAVFADLAIRLGARTDADRRRVQFAVIDIPYGAARAALSAGGVPDRAVEALVADAVLGVLEPLRRRRS